MFSTRFRRGVTTISALLALVACGPDSPTSRVESALVRVHLRPQSAGVDVPAPGRFHAVVQQGVDSIASDLNVSANDPWSAAPWVEIPGGWPSGSIVLTVTGYATGDAQPVVTGQIQLPKIAGVQDVTIPVFPGPFENLATGPLKIQGAGPLEVGQIVALTVTAAPAPARVFWGSLDTAVVRVDGTGQVRAAAAGHGRIVAVAGPRADTAEIDVSAPAARLDVSPDSLVATSIGDTLAIVAVARDGAGNPIPTATLAWSIGDSSVARPLGSGRYLALASGRTAVTVSIAARPNTARSIPVRVDPRPASLRIGGTSAFTAIGDTAQLTAHVQDARGHDLVPQPVVRWSSSDPAIVRVDSAGMAVAVAAGTTTISASSGTVSASVTLEVRPQPVKIALLPARVSLREGDTTTVVGTVLDRRNHPVGVVETWAIQNETVARLEATSRVRAVHAGQTILIASAASGAIRDSIAVVVTAVRRVAAHLSIVRGNGQTALAGAVLGDSIVVRATDSTGAAVPGALVTWRAEGNGQVHVLRDSTSAQGLSAATWTAPTVAGATRLWARLPGVDSVAIDGNVVAAAAVHVIIAPSNPDTLRSAGDTLQFTAAAADTFGNPVHDSVHWTSSQPSVAAINSAGVLVAATDGMTTISATVGSVSATRAVVVRRRAARVDVSGAPAALTAGDSVALTATVRDARGAVMVGAPVTWASSDATLATVTPAGMVHGVRSGTVQITASSTTATGTTTFDVRSATVATLAIVQGNGQTTAAGAPFADTLVVRARDAGGNPVPRARITWRTTGNGALLPLLDSTDANGLVRAVWTARTAAGPDTVRARVAADTTVFANFTGTVHPGPVASITLSTSADTLTALADTARYTTALRDTYGNTAGAAVVWSSSNPAVATVDSLGRAVALAAGATTLTATVGSVTATRGLVVAPRAATIAITPASASPVAGDTIVFHTSVADRTGHALAGAVVTWGSSAPAVGAIDSTGRFLALTPGATTITAASGPASTTISITVGPGAAAAMTAVAGNGQSATAGAAYRDSVVVRVTNLHGVPVAAVAVAWTATADGAASAPNVVTASDGTARVRWTARTTVGPDTLIAAASGLPSVRFMGTVQAAAVATVTLASAGDTLTSIGDTVHLSAVARDAHGNVVASTFAWTSSDTTVIRVAPSGDAIAIGQGSATITATAGSVSGTRALAVRQAASTIQISPASPSLIAGDTLRLSATVRDTRGHAISSAPVAWASGTPSVATVDSTGRLIAANAGTSTVTAASGAATASVTVAVSAGTAATMTIVGGAGQTAAAGQAYADSAVVRLTNAHGLPVSGVSVSWTATADAAVSAATSPTGADGTARVRWTARTTVGADTLTAASGALGARFTGSVQAAAVATVTLASTRDTLTSIGDTAHVTAVARDAHGNVVPGAFAWASSDTAVMRVSSSGDAVAVAQGTATITATAGSVSGTRALVVRQVSSALQISPATPSLIAGDTLGLTAAVHDARGHAIPGAPVTWASGTPSVASVDSTGRLIAVSAGSTTVTAASGAATASVTVAVSAGAAAAMTIAGGAGQTAPAGQSYADSAVVRLTNSHGLPVPGVSVTWTATADGAASAASTSTGSDGTARVRWTARTTAGPDTLTAASGALSARFTASVQAAAVASVTLASTRDTLTSIGDTLHVTAVARDAHGNVVATGFTWTSSDTTVIRVSASGDAVAGAQGSSTVTATAGSVSGTRAVVVRQLPSTLMISPATPSLIAGDTLGLTAAVHDARGHAVPGAAITWASGTPSVASVDSTGRVIALGVGSSTVTAASGVATASVSVAVSAGSAVTMTIVGGAGQTVAAGQAYADSAVVRVTNAHALPVPGVTVSWTATADGLASAASAPTGSDGTARVRWTARTTAGPDTLTASSGALNARFTGTVQAAAVASVTLASTTDTLTSIGDTAAVSATAHDAHGNVVATAFTWASSDSSVLTVTATGQAIAAATGSATVTATAAGVTGTRVMRVQQIASTLSVSPPAPSLIAGDTAALSALVKDARSHLIPAPRVTWGSASPAVATVDSTGRLIAVGVGTASITAASGPASSSVTVTVGAGSAATMSKFAGDAQTTASGQVYTDSIAVRLTNAHGLPVPGVTVTWTATADGAVSPTTSATDASGVARTRWTARRTAGADTLHASVGALSAAFTGSVGAGALARVVLNTHALTFTSALDTAQLTVSGYDSNNNTVSTGAITWSGTDTLAAAVEPSGIVVPWHYTAAPAKIIAAVGGLADTATVTLAPVAHEVRFVTGPLALTAQDTVFATSLGDSVTVNATAFDARGNPIYAPDPAFAALDSGLVLVGTNGVGDQASRLYKRTASATYRVTAGGTFRVRAFQDGKADTVIVAVRQVAATIALNPTTASITAGDSAAVLAVVRDARGAVIAGAPVSWSSGTPGVATVTGAGLIHGVAPGSATITSTSGAATATVSVSVTAGAPASLAKTGGDAQVGTVGTPLTDSVAIRVTDANGFGVPGVSVIWTKTATAAVSPATSTTDAQGYAKAGWTLRHEAGADTLVASASGLPPATFTATATAGAAARLALSPDSAVFDAMGDTVRVSWAYRDAFGNPVSGPTPTWSGFSQFAFQIADATGSSKFTSVSNYGQSWFNIIGTAAGLADTTKVMEYQRAVSIATTTDTIPAAARDTFFAHALGDTVAVFVEQKDHLGSDLNGPPGGLNGDGSKVTYLTTVQRGAGANLYFFKSLYRATAVGTQRFILSGTYSSVQDTFYIVVSQDPASVAVTPGSATLQAGDSTALAVTVRDSRANVIAAAVTWSSSDSTIATVSGAGLVHGLKPGTARFRAVSGAIADSALITVTAGAPATFTRSAGNAQTGTVGSTLTDSAIVRVTDANGFGVPGVSVTWTPTTTASASPTTSTTDAQGYAKTAWTLRHEALTDSLRASASGLTPVTFTATANAGSFSRVDIAESSLFFTSFRDSLRVHVRGIDAFGNTTTLPSVTWAQRAYGNPIGSYRTTGDSLVSLLNSSYTTGYLIANATGTSDSVRIDMALVPVRHDFSLTAGGAAIDTLRISAIGDTAVLAWTVRDSALIGFNSPTSYGTAPANVVSAGYKSWTTVASAVPGYSDWWNRSNVIALAAGTAWLKITSSGRTDSLVVVVQQVPATAAVSPASATLQAGDSTGLSVIVRDSRSNVIATPVVTWTSSDSTVASVSGAGRVHGLKPGTARIRALSGSAADSATITVTAGVPANLTKSAGDAQTGTVGIPVADSAAVRVTDANGFGVEGVSVTWTPTITASASPATSTTDAQGYAKASWTLRHEAGADSLIATAGVLSPVTFTATAQAAAAAQLKFASHGQIELYSVNDTATVAYAYHDAFGNSATGPAPTVSTTNSNLAITSGPTSATVVSGWSTDQFAIKQLIVSGAGFADTVPIRFRQAAAAITHVNYPSGTAAPDTVFANSIGDTVVVANLQVDARGNPIMASGGQAILGADTVGVFLGASSAGGAVSGYVSFRATRSGTMAVKLLPTFSNTAGLSDTVYVTVRQVAAAIDVTPDSAGVIAGDSVQFTAVVKDARGNAIAGAPVTWTSDDATVATVTSTGLARTVGAGTAVIAATSGTAADSVVVSATAAGPASASILDGNTQTGTVGTQLAQPIRVKVLDSRSRPLSGVTVTWSATANGSVSGPTSVTDSTGVAQASWTLRHTPGADTAKASVGALPVISFTATATVGSAKTVAISAAADSMFSFGDTLALTAVVTDTFSNVISAPVTWSSGAPAAIIVDASGHAVAIANGTSVITATSGSVAGTRTLVVSQKVADVALTALNTEVTPGDTTKWTAAATDARGNAISTTISWTTDNPAVATVANGTVTGVGTGTANITATAGSSTKAQAVTVLALLDPAAFAVSLAGANDRQCALSSNGTALCWGNNAYGQIGDGTKVPRGVPVAVSTGVKFVSIAAGQYHTCAVTATGTAYCWGENSAGYLGDGTVNPSTTPVAVTGGLVFARVAVSNQGTCGLTTSRRIYCWGNNTSGQLGDGTTSGTSKTPKLIASPYRFKAIAADPQSYTVCALRTDGRGFCWGANGSGQLGIGSTTPASTGTLQLVSGTHAFTDVTVGLGTVCALEAGALFCWGTNNYRYGDNTTTASYTPVAAGQGQTFSKISTLGGTCGITTGGVAMCWGQNANHEATGSGVVPTPRALSGNPTYTSVAALNMTSCGTTPGSQVECWGGTIAGGLGTGPLDNTSSSAPTPVAGGADFAVPGPIAALSATPTTATLSASSDSLLPVLTAKNAGNTVIPNVTAKWSSSATSVATVGAFTGLIKAVAMGGATITAAADSQKATIAVTVSGSPASVQVSSGDTQTGTVGQALGQPLKVIVRDASSNPVRNATVTWAATANGSVSPASSTTDSTGVAQTTWTLRQAAGVDTATATVGALPIVTFLATAQAGGAKSVTVNATADTLFSLGDTIQVTAVVRDTFSNVISSPTVVWSSSVPAVLSVDAQGHAVAVSNGSAVITGTSGTASGTHTLVVSQRPSTLVVSPDSSDVIAGDSAQISVVVRDARAQVIATPTVAWTSRDTTVATVTVTGLARTIAAGRGLIVATSGQVADTAVLIVTPAGPASASILDGNAQAGTVGAALGQPIRVKVLDSRSHPVAGVTVGWAATAEGNIGAPTTTTDASGIAQTTWTLRHTVGADTARATIGALPVLTFTATAQAGAVKTITLSAASDSLFSIGDTVVVTAVARDTFANVVSSPSITWTSGTPAALTVDVQGHAVAVANGTSIITAAVGSVNATHTLVVQQRASSVAVAPAALTVGLGATGQLTGTVKDARGVAITSATPTWGTSNASVATVSGTGLVTGVALGSATITATYSGLNGTSTAQVVNLPYGATVNADTPFLFWRFNDLGATAADSSGNSHPGTQHTPITVGAQPVIGNDVGGHAYMFNGASSWVDVNTTATSMPKYAIEAWIQPSVLGSQREIASAYGAAQLWFEANGTVTYYHNTGSWQSVTSTAVVNAGQRAHIVGMYDGTAMKLYVNAGTPVTKTVAVLNGQPTNFRAGTASSGPRYFSGLIDEVAFYTHDLTVSRISAHYLAGTQGEDPPTTITITSPKDTLTAIGDTVQLSASVQGGSGSTLGNFAAWSSSNPSVATVTPTGQVVAVANGTVTITATNQAATANRTMVVQQVATTLSVAGLTGTVAQGDSIPVDWTATDSRGVLVSGLPAGFSTSNASVATVSTDGMVVAVAPGTAVITVTVNSLTRTGTITVGNPTYSQAVLFDAPEDYLRFNETSGTVARDSSGNGRDANFVVAPALGVSSLLPSDASGHAYTFNGSTTWLRYTFPTPQLPAKYAIEAWVQPSSIVATEIMSLYGNAFQLQMSAAGKVVYYHWNGGWQSVTSTASLVVGTRYHLVGTYDGAKMHLYINGTEAATAATVTKLTTAQTEFRVGTSSTGPRYWPGVIDEPAIYFRALTPQRVRSHYQAAVAGVPAGMSKDAGDTQSGSVGAALGTQLSAKVVDAIGNPVSNATVTWAATSNGSVSPASSATDGTGVARTTWTLRQVPGADTATATLGGLTATFTATATVGPATTIVLSTPGDTLFSVGDTVPVSAVARDTFNNLISSPSITWTSGTPAALSVNSAGKAVAIANGSSVITATSGSAVATRTLVVKQRPVSAALNPTAKTVAITDTTAMTMSVLDARGNAVGGATVTWQTSDGTVATVNSSGQVIAVAAGSATITATVDTLVRTATFTVLPSLSPASFPNRITLGYPSCALRAADSTAVCWGTAYVGDGTTSLRQVPVAVSGGRHFVSVSTNFGQHACGLQADGQLFCWGQNTSGATGLGTSAGTATVPTAVLGGLRFAVQQAGTTSNHCAITLNYRLYCWGDNTYGQLANGTYGAGTSTTTAVSVAPGLRFTSVAVGRAVCGITVDGDAYCWGDNTNGTVGNGSTGATPVTAPSLVGGGRKFKSITTDATQAVCGLTTADQMYCWGYNYRYAAGNGVGNATYTSPTLGAGGMTFKQISVGYYSTCGLTFAGSAYCWGNSSQMVGGSTTTPKPLNMGGLTLSALSANTYAVCGITTTDDGYCWGDPYNYMFGKGISGPGNIATLKPVPMAGGHDFAVVGPVNSLSTPALALNTPSDSASAFTALNPGATPIPGVMATWTAPSATDSSRFSYSQYTGQVSVWGNATVNVTTDGKSGSVSLSVQNPVTPTSRLGFAAYGGCMLTPEGRPYCVRADTVVGTYSFSGFTAVRQPLAFTQIASSAGTPATNYGVACGLVPGGTLYCWGANPAGVLGLGDYANHAVATAVPSLTWTSVAVVDSIACGIAVGGAAYCWGDGIPNGTAMGANVATNRNPSPLLVSGGRTWTKIAIGYGNSGNKHVCAIESGTADVYCWGLNNNGELGDSTITQRAVPVKARFMPEGATDLALGTAHTCALGASGSVYCWGINSNRELGDSTVVSSYYRLPVKVTGGLTFTAIAAGWNTTCGLTSAQTIYCWGLNAYASASMFGTGSLTPSVSGYPLATAGGRTYTELRSYGDGFCAVATAGGIYCWGRNDLTPAVGNSPTIQPAPFNR